MLRMNYHLHHHRSDYHHHDHITSKCLLHCFTSPQHIVGMDIFKRAKYNVNTLRLVTEFRFGGSVERRIDRFSNVTGTQLDAGWASGCNDKDWLSSHRHPSIKEQRRTCSSKLAVPTIVVSCCFEPSQTLGVTAGLSRTYNIGTSMSWRV